ncbi:hypothetical protein AU468_10805 [Alkalispirochaeta sphaeroplastigenens]|uniref:Probable chemoreceptor glutamine deamidase CheD n=1 Tax=Alkalispirochaeta sphaeroplastigenens TaxID=1187066 RepID=A0A2S4JHS0_9SPIO|nr:MULTISPECIES: hypothetical protein [Alkalispirochaeta]POQ99097.1 hypothetical protein AU468_10805 [Alkalispirochaeta sphaeroplastigenens]
MYTHFDQRFGYTTSTIHPGEYYSTSDDIIIATILGSCIAVAFYDPVKRQGGMNHFMLPGELHSSDYYRESSGRYGMFAMELIINDLIKKGSRRENLVAKVFGGGHVLHNTSSGRIPESNIKFALDFLETEKIPVVSKDVGGYEARKVLFFARTSRVLLKRFKGQLIKPVEREESAYLARIKKKKDDQSKATFF